jgi:hypothetical protein
MSIGGMFSGVRNSRDLYQREVKIRPRGAGYSNGFKAFQCLLLRLFLLSKNMKYYFSAIRINRSFMISVLHQILFA